MSITEINKDTFWSLIDQAKEHPRDPDGWLMGQLASMGPEQAKKFDTIARVYMDAAHQYGLWTAASVMSRSGCSDDGFIDFRSWLVAQGKDVYLAALKDPDTLADAPSYQDQRYDFLPHIGGCAYEELTGRDIYRDFDPDEYHRLETEIKPDIAYGDGIGYPYGWCDVPAYVPRLCSRYMAAEELTQLAEGQQDTWNPTSPEIKAARATARKSSKINRNRGDAR